MFLPKEKINMKILAIISSFRKQNTYNTIKQIESIHQSLYDCEYEYLFLKDLNLMPCNGCHLCLTKGEQHCPLKDDRDVIISKIESADGVILASPNHTMNVNWVMKNFIDRLSYLMHRPQFFDQRFMILITSGSYMGVKQAVNALSPMASGGKVINKLAVMNSPNMNESKTKKKEKKVLNAANKFAKMMEQNHSFKASFGNMIWFSVFKAMTYKTEKEFPADYAYYENKRFFVDTKLNIIQKSIISMFTNFFLLLYNSGII